MAQETAEAGMMEKDGEMTPGEGATMTGTPDEGMEMEATPTGEMMPHDDAMGAGTEEAMGESMAEKTPEAGMMDGEMMDSPAFFSAELTDVLSGQAFSIQDYQGKVILVETMAVWCPTCLRQQVQIQALQKQLGENSDLVLLSLDVDPNEDAALLKEHAEKNDLSWGFAVAPAEVSREIAQLLGEQFLNPPSAPVFVIDRKGSCTRCHLASSPLKNCSLQSSLI
jgi:cytochrome oxidase Cu insertion factor (SCO1/SenC/PrrC family)